MATLVGRLGRDEVQQGKKRESLATADVVVVVSATEDVALMLDDVLVGVVAKVADSAEPEVVKGYIDNAADAAAAIVAEGEEGVEVLEAVLEEEAELEA